MLKQIPAVISPDLMSLMMRMGHGDDIVLADGHFPADALAQRIVRADGHGVLTLLSAILKFLPLDTFTPENAIVMRPVDPREPEPLIWSDMRQLLQSAEQREIRLTAVSRDDFYERARKAYAVVATSDVAHYANLILKKGHAFPE